MGPRWKLVLTALLVVALAAVVIQVVFRARTPDAPPQLTARKLAVIAHQGWVVEPDASATRDSADQARRLADRYGPTSREPARRVTGVSLATMGHSSSAYAGQRVWVVYVEHVVGHCLGICGEPSGEQAVAREVVVVDAESLVGLGSMVF